MESNQVSLQRLTRRSDYQKAFKFGHRIYPNHWMIVNYRANEESDTRFGWTIPRFVGTAVVRNKFKRWLKEYLRRHKVDASKSFDVNFVFKRKSREFYKTMGHQEFDQACERAFKKLANE